jgi:adenylosuccinate synthase
MARRLDAATLWLVRRVCTRYAAEINGFSSVALTKLDVLDTLDEIKVCTGYKLNGRVCESLPACRRICVASSRSLQRYPAGRARRWA